MSAHGQVRMAVFLVLVVAFFVGLWKRGRSLDCYSFTAYLVATFGCGALPLVWPEIFWTPQFYVAKEALYGLLKLAIALELAYRIFGLFPGAMARARVLLGPLAILGLIALVRLVAWKDYGAAITTDGAALNNWTIWLLSVTGVLMLYYHLPALYMHRAILFGLVLYLGIFTTLLNALRTYGVDHVRGLENARLLISSLNGYAYLALVGWWVYAAWRPATEPDLSAETLAMIRERTA